MLARRLTSARASRPRRAVGAALALVALAAVLAGCSGTLVQIGYNVGTGPGGIAALDVDKDGRLDLLVANTSGSTLVAEAQGPHGSFSRLWTLSLPKGAAPRGVAAGRFSGRKGPTTAAVAETGANAVALVTVSASGAKVAQVIRMGSGSAPWGVAVGDVNHDRYDDLVVTTNMPALGGDGSSCTSHGCVVVFHGSKKGLKTRAGNSAIDLGTSDTTRYDPRGIALADVNHDGFPDLVVAAYGTNEILVLHGLGHGRFESPDRGQHLALKKAQTVIVRDVRQIRRQLIIGWSGEAGVRDAIFRASESGPGTFAAATDAERTSWDDALGGVFVALRVSLPGMPAKLYAHDLAIFVGDLDGDGLPDAATGGTGYHDVTVILSRQGVYDGPASMDFGSETVGTVGPSKNLHAHVELPDGPPKYVLSGPDADSFQVPGVHNPDAAFTGDLRIVFAPKSPGVKRAVLTLLPPHPLRTGLRSVADANVFAGGTPTVQLTGTGVGTAPPPQTRSAPLAVGVAEDASKFADDGGAKVYGDLKQLGMSVNRWVLTWDPSNPSAQLPFVDRAAPVAERNGIDIVLSLYPQTASRHDAVGFCDWVLQVAKRYYDQGIRRFIIGNEVNATRFWSPQHLKGNEDWGAFTYFTTLSRCYDALKGFQSDIQVIGLGLAPRAVDSNSTKPLEFIRALGRAYKTTGRTTPIMDALAIHPYPNPNAKPPPAPDKATYQDPGFFGIPQLDRVKQAVYDAFNGTGQPTTLTGLPLVVDEVGYQTDTAGHPQYSGTETSPTVSEAQQAQYYARVVGMYACDPAVSDVLLFHLIDESQRNPDTTSGGWQSGLEYPDGSHKPSFDAVKQAIAAGCTGKVPQWAPTAASASR